MRTFAERPKATLPTAPARFAAPDRAGAGQGLEASSCGDHAVRLRLQADAGQAELARPPRPGRDFSRVPTRPSSAEGTKLAINRLGDVCEQEADRVSEAVMREGGGRVSVGQTSKEHSSGMIEATVPSSVDEVTSSPGQSLESPARRFMELRFGRDFGDVRVHSDARAAQSADVVSARAYTVGRNLVFGTGEYAPGTVRGRSLIAHELAHVVQQRNSHAPPRVLQRAPKTVNTSAGAFVADPYDLTRVVGHGGATVGHGVDVTIKFKANERVDAEKIAFVQTARSIKDDKVHNRFSDDKRKAVAESRMVPSGKPGEGTHIDQMPEIATPLYGMTGSREGDLSGPVPAKKLTEIGWHYRDSGGSVKNNDAMLHDEPDLNSGDLYTAAADVMKGEWGQDFETSAIAVAGNQKGTFYGTVNWGWVRKSASENAGLLDFKVKSKNLPSPVFMEAARLWNASVTTDKKETIDLPVEVRVTSASADLWDSPDRRRKIATLAKGTSLGRTAMVDPKGRIWWASVIVTDGKSVGKAGWVKEVDLY